MEKLYKKLGSVGVNSLVIGILTMISGIAFGIVMIVNGARTIRAKKQLMF